jgi:hypothetical protein
VLVLFDIGYPCTIPSRQKNKMASRFVPVDTDEQILVLNEAAVSQNTKKAAKFCLTVCRGIL